MGPFYFLAVAIFCVWLIEQRTPTKANSAEIIIVAIGILAFFASLYLGVAAYF